MNIRSISAVTLAVADMARSVNFYGDKIGLDILHGGTSASFTSYKVGDGYINLILEPSHIPAWWGRLIFYVDDVDSIYKRLVDAGLHPTTRPADAPWGERYFHISDPDLHELSFAKAI